VSKFSLLIGLIVIVFTPAVRFAAAAEDLAAAKSNYQTFCVKCHGAGGKGDGASAATLKTKPRDFTDCARMKTLSDDTLFKVIKNGGAANALSGDMPAWSQGFEDDEIHGLVAFVRSFCKK
jgi:mono/diheme cytochrome c family protein